MRSYQAVNGGVKVGYHAPATWGAHAPWRLPSATGLVLRRHMADFYSAVDTLSRLTQAEVTPLRAQGAVGEILAQVIDAQGNTDCFEVNARVMAVGLDLIAKAGARVLACGGAARTSVIRAAHAPIGLTTLVTDEATARLLAHPTEQ